MTARISFFPVGNGDMTLIETASGKKILIDCNIRQGDDYPDVSAQLRKRLDTDTEGRTYVDLFIWTHPDVDHCRGIEEHFHLGPLDEWNEQNDKIIIRGIWASPIVFKRASKNHTLTPDAKALNTEVKRRINECLDPSTTVSPGDHVLLVTEGDDDFDANSIAHLVQPLDSKVTAINGEEQSTFSCRILGPSPTQELEEDEVNLGKNHSSIIARFTLDSSEGFLHSTRHFLLGGDAEVTCWEFLWKRLSKPLISDTDWLEYHILSTPHHCSWHTLSYDSWKDSDDPQPSEIALKALSQTEDKPIIVASSNSIADDGNDPPCWGAKLEYEKITNKHAGTFKCVADHKVDGENVPLIVVIDDSGGHKFVPPGSVVGGGAGGGRVNRKGGGKYA